MIKENVRPWLVCLSAALFFCYEFIQMAMFNSISMPLTKTFNLNATTLGYLSSTYFYAIVSFSFFAGMLIDYFSVRKIILMSMTLCVAATFVFSLSSSIWIIGITHFLSGVGDAFCFLCCIKLASRWFPSQRMAFVVGMMVAIAMTGGVIAQMPLSLLVTAVGWRQAVMLNTGLGLFILGIIFITVRDYPQGFLKHAINFTDTPHTSKTKIAFILKNKQNFLVGIFISLLNLPVILLGELWGIMYLNQAKAVPVLQASTITTMIFVGTIIGSPLTGWISDKWGRRRLPMLIGTLTSLITILMIMFVPHLNFVSLLILFLLLGLFSSAQIIGYPVIAESNPTEFTAAATSLASILIMGGGVVFQPLIGGLLHRNWDGTMVKGIPLYSPHAFMVAMMIMPIAFVIAGIVVFYLQETYCKSLEKQQKARVSPHAEEAIG